MKTGVGNDYKRLLSVALAAVLVSAVYVPIHVPFPQAMATPAAMEITNQTTCGMLPAEVTVEWIDPNVCRIVSGTLLVGEGIILRVASGVVLEITNSGGLQLGDGTTLDNDGSIDNDGTINIELGATMDNNGDFYNAGTMDNNGDIDTTGATLTNDGQINNDCLGTVTGTVTNLQPNTHCEIVDEETCEGAGASWLGDDVCELDTDLTIGDGEPGSGGDESLTIGPGITFNITPGTIVTISVGAESVDDFVNDGGTINNHGTIRINGATVFNEEGVFNNYGHMENFDATYTGGDITTDDVFNNFGTINCDTTGCVAVFNGATFSNEESGSININHGGAFMTIFNNGLFNNFGAVNNEGGITINPGGFIQNEAAIVNDGLITNNGNIENGCEGEITGAGSITGTGGVAFDCDGDLGMISGTKFIDEDNDGEWDRDESFSEPTLEGVRICAFEESMDEPICDETDEDGDYQLVDLPVDISLKIYEEVPGGYKQTAPEDFADEEVGLIAINGSYFITLDPEEILNNLDFGNIKTGAIIGNDDVILGVGGEGQLNVAYRAVPDLGLPEEDPVIDVDEDGPLGIIGLRNGSGEFSAVEQGTPAEGWGIAGDILAGPFSAYANSNEEEGVENIEIESFTGVDGGETAESVVIVRNGEDNPILRITHYFEPSEETGSLYKITVTVENIGEEQVDDVIYRRAMDWDIDPTPFDEFVTIQGAEGNPAVLNSGNNGFINMDILDASEPEDFVSEEHGTVETVYNKDFIDLGPADHGAAFDFDLGDIPTEATASMTIFYGVDDNEEAALDALDSENVQLRSLGQSDLDGEADNLGEQGPTFMFALGEIIEASGEGENSPPVADAGPDQTVDEEELVELDGTGSSDEETDSEDLEYSWAQLSGPAVVLTGNGTANPTFTAPSNINTVLVFSLTVNDGTENSTADTVSVTVHGRGDITIRKVEQGTSDLLAGSAFTITPNPLTLSGPLVVADNDDNDSDPAAGIIKIEGAGFSTYTIVESQVPVGYAKIVNSLTVVVNSGNTAPVVTVQNLNVEQDIEETVEVPPPQLDEDEVDDLGDNGATVNGQPVNSTNLPPALIVPPDEDVEAPDPVIFSSTAPPNTNGSTLFTSFNIPTYQPPDQSIANQTIYAPPAIVIPKDDGSNFVLTPVIEEVFVNMTMLLTPPASTATSLTSIQSVEIEFGQGGSGIGFSFDLSSEIPEGLPEIEDIEQTALFLDVDFVGNVNFSNPSSFGSPPALTILVSRSLDGETLPDGCPDVALYLLNENTNEWEEIDTPERNPAGDTADECSYIVHPEHFSRFAIGGVTGTITNVSTRPGGGGGGSRTVIIDGTFSDSYFAANPLARIGVTGTTFAAPNGQVDSEFAVGEQVQISTTIRNYQQGPQTYAFIVQILDENGVVQSISWQTGMLDRGQEYSVGQSWLAEAAGNYQVRIFVWDGLTAPDPLSSVEVRMLQVSDAGPIQSA